MPVTFDDLIPGQGGASPFTSEEARRRIEALIPGVRVTSGARTRAENRRLPGSAPNSMHLDAMALDFVPPPDMRAADIRARLQAAGLPITEWIDKPHGTGPHVHWGWRGAGQGTGRGVTFDDLVPEPNASLSRRTGVTGAVLAPDEPLGAAVERPSPMPVSTDARSQLERAAELNRSRLAKARLEAWRPEDRIGITPGSEDERRLQDWGLLYDPDAGKNVNPIVRGIMQAPSRVADPITRGVAYGADVLFSRGPALLAAEAAAETENAARALGASESAARWHGREAAGLTDFLLRGGAGPPGVPAPRVAVPHAPAVRPGVGVETPLVREPVAAPAPMEAAATRPVVPEPQPPRIQVPATSAVTEMAERMGIRPAEPVADIPSERAPGVEPVVSKPSVAAPEQSRPGETQSPITANDIEQAKEMMRTWNAKPPRGESLLNEIIRRGGLRTRDNAGNITPEGSEIMAILGDTRRPGLINNRVNRSSGAAASKQPMTLGELQGWMESEGYLPPRSGPSYYGSGYDVQMVLDLLDREARGDLVFRHDSDAAAFIRYQQDIDRMMSEVGVHSSDTPEIAARKLRDWQQTIERQNEMVRQVLDAVERDRAEFGSIDHHQAAIDDALRDLGYDLELYAEGERLDVLRRRRERTEPAEIHPEGTEKPEVVAPEARDVGDLGEGPTEGGRDAATGPRAAGRERPLEDDVPFQRPRKGERAFTEEPGTEGFPQLIIPGAERTAEQLAKAREAEGRGRIKPRREQKAADEGLFAPKRDDEPTLFQERRARVATTPEAEAIHLGQGVYARPSERITPRQMKALDDVQRFIERAIPKAEIRAGERLYGKDATGAASEIYGATYREGMNRVIAWSLESPDAKGTVKHEAIHWLRREGFIRPNEWSALTKAAERGNWIDKHNIQERYGDLSREAQLEEAVAEEFAAWRRAHHKLPDVVQRVFERMARMLAGVAARVRSAFGKNATADDIFARIESGEVGRRTQRGEVPKNVSIEAKYQVPRGKHEKPPSALNRLLGEKTEGAANKISQALDRFVPDSIHALGEALKRGITPMAAGTPRARAAAKDFANAMRQSRFEWNRVDKWIQDNFTPDQRRRMWEAADEQSVLEQEGSPIGPDEGLNRLAPEEREAVRALQDRALQSFRIAQSLDMVKGNPLPSYVPRMVVEMTSEGPRRAGRPDAQVTRAGTMGGDLRTTTPQLKHRKYLTTAETERAARTKLGENVNVVRDIRALSLANAKLDQAIAGRLLVEQIKKIGKEAGDALVVEGGSPNPREYFTIDHPALRTWAPRLAKSEETGKWAAIKDVNGEMVFESRPLMISKEFEGPLRAVLDQRASSSGVYQAVMNLKGKALSVIMYSPLMHNAVIWGKAIPAAPKQILSFRIYKTGREAMRDQEFMKGALNAGLDPIGHRYFNQDITAIAETPDLAPGRSWTSQVLSYVPGLFDKGAGETVKRAVDKFGDVWHNTFLWDRVGELQVGIYKTVREASIRKGLDEASAAKLAAHFANRYAGALPIEAMSRQARMLANTVLFSRSFTLGNIAAFKDLVVGLPRDIQAQILRDKGLKTLARVQGEARRKAASMLVMDVALSHAGLWLAAGATYFIAREVFGSDQPFVSPYENEPGREDRFFIGYDDEGTAIYGRLPTGKVGEDLVHWLTEPLAVTRRKLSPFVQLALAVASNDRGFGRKLYDPNPHTVGDYAKNIGRIMWHAMDTVSPVDEMFDAARDLAEGRGDPTVAAGQLILPATGLTISHGAPGGPPVGQLYEARSRHEFEVEEALPAIRDKIRDGDIAGARADMRALNIPPQLQNYYIRTTRNPRLRLSPKAMRDFSRYASPEQKAEMERLRGAAQPAP